MTRELWLSIAAVCLLGGCATPDQPEEVTDVPEPVTLEVVQEFADHRPTGLAFAADGRLFVNFPRWSEEHGDSVVAISSDGVRSPYPDADWNLWDGRDPGHHFVCVQSVWTGPEGDLWVLDAASPLLRGVVPGGAKLVRIDTASDTVTRIYAFDATVAPPQSYLNDVRVDPGTGTAFITDSGLGALIVLDLPSGEARRVLEYAPALQAEPGLVPVIGGRELRTADGSVPRINADGIALDLVHDRLYLHALSATHLAAIDTGAILDPAADLGHLSEDLEDLGPTVVCDGMLCDRQGDVYMTALEQDAIVVWRRDGTLETVVSDPRIAWPDSLAWGPDDALYFTTSQIHRQSAFGGERTEPFRVFRVSVRR